jgi:uncharacterized protein YpuA (DUF1002 family)
MTFKIARCEEAVLSIQHTNDKEKPKNSVVRDVKAVKGINTEDTYIAHVALEVLYKEGKNEDWKSVTDDCASFSSL